MNQEKDKKRKTVSDRTDFFARFGVGEHLEHPSFALDDCDYEGVDLQK